MDPILFFAIILLAILTVVACFTQSSKRLILILLIQAAIVTTLSLVVILLEAMLSWHSDLVLKLGAAIGEWVFAVIIGPLILYLAVLKTKDIHDEPRVGIRKTAIAIAAIVLIHLIGWLWLYPSIHPEFIIFAPVILVLSIDFLFIATRDDPIKVLVGLSIAETALFPFIEQAPLFFIPPLLLLINFVNIVAVFLIIHAYREFGVLSISEWRRLM